MKKLVAILVACAGIALTAGMLMGCGSGTREGLYVYAEGCFRPPIEEIAQMYEEKTGTKINTDYSGCGELLAKIEQTQMGDLYISHTPFLGALEKRGYLDKGRTMAVIKPVILVQKGNPMGIEGLESLVKSDARVALPDPMYSTTGHIVSRMMEKSGLKEEMQDNIKTRSPEGSGAANAVSIGTVDAAIVWDIFATMRSEKTEPIQIEEKYQMKREEDAVSTATFGKVEMDYIRVTTATLTTSKKTEKARDFARFMASKKNQDIWKKHGYSLPNPDRPHPSLNEDTMLELEDDGSGQVAQAK